MLNWVRANEIGDLASILGVLISIVGFIATLIGVFKSKNAAQQAAAAASAARDSIRLFDTIVDFSSAIATLDEIKRLHRQRDSWSILPDRYAMIRKTLIQLRGSNHTMTDEQSSVIQNAIVNLADIEKQVEKSLSDPSSLKSAKFNSLISDDIDGLVAVLTQLRIQGTGGLS